MNLRRIGGFAAIVFFLAVTTALADVNVVVSRNDNDHATPDFKFDKVPSPAPNNAAINAKFSIVDGSKDDNSADVAALHDGKLPTEQDQPASNFFFSDSSTGGSILVDLGSPIDIKQINTYSWHTDTRAPQVYSVYSADNATTKTPGAAGLKLIAKVDTRPKDGDPGGQYGVSISDSSGSLGKIQYLLFVMSSTESDDDFGNTFYSEINIIDSKELLAPPGATTAPGDQPGVKLVQIDRGRYTATIDTTEAPDLTDWANNTLAPVVANWYPQIVAMLPSEGYKPPTHFSITFLANMDGVAFTVGGRVSCAARWYRQNLRGEGVGSVVHELVHVVQNYGSPRIHHHSKPNPTWLVEGMADYIRWYQYEPQSHGAAISRGGFARANYDGSYRITANFLNWTIQHFDRNLIKQLDTVMRHGDYTSDIWVTLTGKTVQELSGGWKNDLAKSLGLPPVVAPTSQAS